MSLQVPDYPSPYAAAALPAAYAYISTFSVNIDTGQGGFGVVVYTDRPSYAAGRTPVDRIAIAMGDLVAPGVRTRTLAELMSDPTFAAAWNTVASSLLADAQLHPKLAGATTVS